MVSDISEDGGRETVGLIHDASPGVESAFMRADASKPEDHEALVRATVERFGTLRVACNNAGVAGELNPVADLIVEGWRRVIELNLSGVFYAMRAQIPRMLEAGGGAIVNMSSVLGQVATAGAAGYVSAKHGLVGLTRVAALEYAPEGRAGQRGRSGIRRYAHAARSHSRGAPGAGRPAPRRPPRPGRGGGGAGRVAQQWTSELRHGRVLSRGRSVPSHADPLRPRLRSVQVVRGRRAIVPLARGRARPGARC